MSTVPLPLRSAFGNAECIPIPGSYRTTRSTTLWSQKSPCTSSCNSQCSTRSTKTVGVPVPFRSTACANMWLCLSLLQLTFVAWPHAICAVGGRGLTWGQVRAPPPRYWSAPVPPSRRGTNRAKRQLPTFEICWPTQLLVPPLISSKCLPFLEVPTSLRILLPETSTSRRLTEHQRSTNGTRRTIR